MCSSKVISSCLKQRKLSSESLSILITPDSPVLCFSIITSLACNLARFKRAKVTPLSRFNYLSCWLTWFSKELIKSFPVVSVEYRQPETRWLLLVTIFFAFDTNSFMFSSESYGIDKRSACVDKRKAIVPSSRWVSCDVTARMNTIHPYDVSLYPMWMLTLWAGKRTGWCRDGNKSDNHRCK